MRADLVFVEDVEGRAEAVAQRGGREASEAEDAVLVAVGGRGPDVRRQGVRVGRHRRKVGSALRGGGHG